MTVVAFTIAVLAEQWKGCQIVAEKRRLQPGGLRMAIRALISLLAAVWFVVLVAGHACSAGRCVVNRCRVAVVACHGFMRADEGERRVGIVRKVNIRPGGAVVAGAARTAMVTVMVVILEVTTDALRIEFVAERVSAVAVGAGQFSVAAQKVEFSVSRMVETAVLPGHRAVTILTAIAATAVVYVIVGVATDTGGRRKAE